MLTSQVELFNKTVVYFYFHFHATMKVVFKNFLVNRISEIVKNGQYSSGIQPSIIEQSCKWIDLYSYLHYVFYRFQVAFISILNKNC